MLPGGFRFCGSPPLSDTFIMIRAVHGFISKVYCKYSIAVLTNALTPSGSMSSSMLKQTE